MGSVYSKEDGSYTFEDCSTATTYYGFVCPQCGWTMEFESPDELDRDAKMNEHVNGEHGRRAKTPGAVLA